MEGPGEYVAADGYYVKGTWVNGAIDGEDITERQDKVWEYNGRFAEGKREGRGVITWFSDNSQYDGDWVDGKMHGEGKFKWSENIQFEGKF